jgi:predicted RND superfamily exporter protein
MAEMKRFVKDVRDVDKKATGNPLQTYEASRQMKTSYENAAWYALGAIAVVLIFDFGSLRYVLLAMLPVGAGALQMFGLLGLLEIPLNPANMIVLPLILGIGIDDGVHVVHDFRRQRGPYRMSPSTASAVLITSLTTIVGFGSLMIASHQGLQSLGRVLTIGVSCCLFTSLIMLPALLTWATRHRPPVEDEPRVESRGGTAHHGAHRRISEPHPGTSPSAVPEIAHRDSVEGMGVRD